MSQVTVNGHLYSDDGSAARDMLNGGAKTWVLPMVSDMLVEVSNAAGSASAAATSEANAAASAASAATSLVATSTTSNALATGALTFTVQAGKQFTPGVDIKGVSQTDSTKAVYGTVASYSGTTLQIAVTGFTGSGTVAAWNFSIVGQQGATGSTGGVAGGNLTGALNDAKGADIAAAATTDLTSATGNLVHITGSGVTISTLTLQVGAERTVIMDGANTLVHSASLDLPGKANIATAAGDRMTVRGDTAGAIVVAYDRANGFSVAGEFHMLVQDEKASGTHGGGAAAGTNIRTLNTVKSNNIPGASLSGNQLHLNTAGTYRCRAVAPLAGSGGVQAYLYNVTDSNVAILGTSANGPELCPVQGEFTITSAKTFDLRQYCASGTGTYGLGLASGSGFTEVYSAVELWWRP